MSELFAAASSAISVTAFAGQLTQSAVFLYEFISNIRDAPSIVRALGDELRILESLLVKIPKSFAGQNTELEQALKHCEKHLNELLAFANRLDSDQFTKKRQRLWVQFRVGIKRSDLAKHLGDLERSKLMLLQACANIARDEQMSHSNLTKMINEDLSNVSTMQNTCKTDLARMESIVKEIRDNSTSLLSTSARVSDFTIKTYSKIDELSDSTKQVQRMAEGLELAAQSLIQERLNFQPIILENFKNEVSRTISSTLKSHFKVHFKPLRENQTPPNLACDGVGLNQPATDAGKGFEAQRCQSEDKHTVPLRESREHPVDKWIKTSCSESRRYLIRNATFGTVSVRTTTISYVRATDKHHHPNIKEVSVTTLMFLPSPWLMSQGAIFTHQRSKLLGGGYNQSIPHWTLSTIHIVDRNSDIITACIRHDLDAIRNLFDEGRASPYDVDERGRNLLGWVAVGLDNYLPEGKDIYAKHESIRRRLKRLDAIITLLIDYGSDPGNLDLDQAVPVSLFAITVSFVYLEFPIVSIYNDHLEFLFKKLLKSVKSDPFSNSHVCISVAHNGEYELFEFPGEPMARYLGVRISELQLGCLQRSQEWPIVWAPNQLEILCSARWNHFSKEVSDVRTHVAFWTTSQAQEVETYLNTKSNFIQMFLDYDSLYPKPRDSLISALHTTIHQGGEVIALLSEHEYHGTGQLPWIRHRFKKLVLLERWLTEVFKHLLTYGATWLDDPDVISSLGNHAQDRNARTLHAWTEAWRACLKDHPQFCRLGMPAALFEEIGKSTRSHKTEVQDADEEWKTEDTESKGSEWETEEEWEEGYILQTAGNRDCYDARHPQISNQERHICDQKSVEYDGVYWERVYSRIVGSKMDTTSQGHSESKLRRLARYGRDFIAALF